MTKQNLTDQTTFKIRQALAGQRNGLRAIISYTGPAIIVSIAYMDPGNFATNIQAGAKYGYGLLWVVVLANLIAMLFQALSGKLGIVTGRNLAELCREHFSCPIVIMMWIASEVGAMATDLAEFLGGAIGLSLLFGMPLIYGMVVTGIVTYALLTADRKGFRPLELIIGGLVGTIALCYLVELFVAPIDWRSAALHSVLPQIKDGEALTLAVGIIGATVMPHAIYLHSSLTQSRTLVDNDADRRTLIKLSNWEVIIALALAGLVNMAMLMMASGAFHQGHPDVAQIETAYHTLGPLLGIGAAGVFLLSLIASGISSSVVGTMAGQVIMQGFVDFKIAIWVRRLITMIPAFIVVGMGVNVTTTLVISQVILSITLPLPMIALLIFTRRHLEREFGHQHVQGAHIAREGQERPKRTPGHDEMQQAERTGLSPQDAKDQVTRLWNQADSGKAFAAGVAAEGWVLAKGDKRDFVLVDRAGETHSLARRIDGVKAADVRHRMADVDQATLPSVAEAKALQRGGSAGAW
jgi:manganese transport protein